jgi:hypothetical protein
VTASKLAAQPGAFINWGITQHVPTGTWYDPVDWVNVMWNLGGMGDKAHDTGSLVAPMAGTYVVEGHVSWTANATGTRQIILTVDGSYVGGDYRPGGNGSTLQGFTRILRLNAGQVLRIRLAQSSGGTLDASNPELTATRVGG